MSTGDPRDYWTDHQHDPSSGKKRKLTLDEILFDDDDTFIMKKKGVFDDPWNLPPDWEKWTTLKTPKTPKTTWITTGADSVTGSYTDSTGSYTDYKDWTKTYGVYGNGTYK